MVSSAADWLAGALSAAADTNGGDRVTGETGLGGDGADRGANQAVQEVGLFTAGFEDLVAYQSEISGLSKMQLYTFFITRRTHTALDRTGVAGVDDITSSAVVSAVGNSSDEGSHGGGEEESDAGEEHGGFFW